MEASTSTAGEKGRYTPKWELIADAVVGEAGLSMKIFQYPFPLKSKKEMEKVPTDVLNANAYRQQFEVSVGFEKKKERKIIIIYFLWV